jgi:hypothetical protein
MVLIAISTSLFAQNKTSKSSSDGFFLRNGLVHYIKGDRINELATAQTLENGIAISPNGLLSYQDGRSSQLKNGELLSFNGILSPNAVEEHFELKDGKLQIVTNGIFTPVEKAMKLENGIMIDENGTTSNGLKLLPSQKMNLSGEVIR